jgi:hypothetical protein
MSMPQFSWRFILLSSALAITILPGSRADYYAAQNGQTPSAPYTAWNSAAIHIQDAVNAATNGATVWVGAGRYTVPPNASNVLGTNVVYINRSLILRSSNGVPATTIIDGSGTNRGIAIASSAMLIVDGFTVSNCWATNQGGGIYIIPVAGTNVIRNCIVSDNNVGFGTEASGGGIYAYIIGSYYYVISNCVFRNNRALSNVATTNYSTGGGVWMGTYPPGYGTIDGCIIESNSAAKAGGMYLHYGLKHMVKNCIIRNNTAQYDYNATYGGGGTYHNGAVEFYNCLIHNNVAYGRGGGVENQNGGLTIFYNCTVVSNRANYGSGVEARYPTTRIYLYNTIVYSNFSAAGNHENISIAGTSLSYFANSCYYPTNLSSTNNYIVGGVIITSPPSFADWAGENYRLLPDSPCLNAGTNQDWMQGSRDLDGNQRVRYGAVDIGAYELIHNATIYRFR